MFIVDELRGHNYIQKFIILTDEKGKLLRRQVNYREFRVKVTPQILFLTENNMYLISNAIEGMARVPVSDIKEIKLLKRTYFLKKDHYIGIITKSGPEFYLKAVGPRVQQKTQDLYKILDAWGV